MPLKMLRSRFWTYGSNSIISILFFLGIIVFVALIAERHPWRVDLTETGVFTLSEQTRNILKGIDKAVNIKVFLATAAPDESKIRDLLETFQYNSKNFTFEFIDPDRNPEVARRYEVKNYGTVVLEGYDKKQTIQTVDEESVTNALLKLTSQEAKKIYFLVGHGERGSGSAEKDGFATARTQLEKENYQVGELNLIQEPGTVPQDAGVVIVAGPQKTLFDKEKASLKSYAEAGGKVLVLLDPFEDGGLKDFLKDYGVDLKEDIVVDESVGLFGGNYLMPVVMQYGSHRITDGFRFATFYPEARSLFSKDPGRACVHLETLASTSQNAWSETNKSLLEQGEVGFDEQQDTRGPVPLMVLVDLDTQALKAPASDSQGGEKKEDATAKEGAGRRGYLLVVGDSDFASNTYFGLSGNGDLFLNMVNFLAEQENLVTIERRQKEGRPLLLTQGQFWMIFWVVLVIMPLLVIAAGLAVYRVRRSQR